MEQLPDKVGGHGAMNQALSPAPIEILRPNGTVSRRGAARQMEGRESEGLKERKIEGRAGAEREMERERERGRERGRAVGRAESASGLGNEAGPANLANTHSLTRCGYSFFGACPFLLPVCPATLPSLSLLPALPHSFLSLPFSTPCAPFAFCNCIQFS